MGRHHLDAMNGKVKDFPLKEEKITRYKGEMKAQAKFLFGVAPLTGLTGRGGGGGVE